MSFLSFYNLQRKDRIFERTFNKFYKSGYFGNIEISIIKEDQRQWFNTLITLIKEKNGDELFAVMESFESKFSRECFDKIVGTKIKYKDKNIVKSEIKKFIIGE
jgi:hypothetical protein